MSLGLAVSYKEKKKKKEVFAGGERQAQGAKGVRWYPERGSPGQCLVMGSCSEEVQGTDFSPKKHLFHPDPFLKYFASHLLPIKQALR